MDLQSRSQQKQISQLQPSNLQIVKENITLEDVESPVLPLAMTTSHTKNAQVLHFDEILKDNGGSPGDLPTLNLTKSASKVSPITDHMKQLDLLESRSDFQIQESQPNNFKNLKQILGVDGPKALTKHRSNSGIIAMRGTKSKSGCLSARSFKKSLPDRKAKTNIKQTKSEKSLLLGVKRAPSDLNVQLEKNWQASYIDLDLSNSHKRKKLNDDAFLIPLDISKGKPSNQAMIKAIDSDDAMDYLRVRKQKGVSKLVIKKANVFDKVVLSSKDDEQLNQNQDIEQLQLDPFSKKQEIISDSSSILGDRWYDKKGIDFKFEVNSNVDSIEFPMNQNLNLKLNLQSLDGEQNQQNVEQIEIDNEHSPESQTKQQFQFTGQKVDLNLQIQIQNDNLVQKEQIPVKSDMKTLQLQKFTLSNIKPFDQLLDMESSDNEDKQ